MGACADRLFEEVDHCGTLLTVPCPGRKPYWSFSSVSVTRLRSCGRHSPTIFKAT